MLRIPKIRHAKLSRGAKMPKNIRRKKLYKKPEMNKVQLNSPEDTAAVIAAAVVIGVVGALVVSTPAKS